MRAERVLRAIAAAGVAACGAACTPLVAPKPQPPLDAAAQERAAEKLAGAFAGPCLSDPDATVATQALRTQGWPLFNTVWREPASVFYAAPPSPAGLFVMGERPWGGAAAQQLSCIGHYSANTAAPMVSAIARRWGPGRDWGGARTWVFRLKAGAATPVSAARGIAPAEAARLAPGEADVFIQVVYNRPLGDVASIIAVSRPARN